ncbi:glycosyltransferase involved in cell wall biosynthesis [Ulvibacter sp. MAR_2010_11]|uniref:glycosyltransferase family 4 protein n=1 Tax=Ulvibacter sp. MAR_2010_11 TaxID=1250229 RepID=UPI000CB860F3|nr:glycosyltransferase family 4 protein [Ulvibacter sp. MAR_2010_11]PKA82912.1 glycosyltransferase involved in cell wall biosynthesis [Ulvibacter sp. MAR_2010_11]
MKVLHILYQSLPQISGSSIRSRDILMSQKEIGIEVVAITSPFQARLSNNGEDWIDGIRYLRTSKRQENAISDLKSRFFARLWKFFSIITFTQKLYITVKKENPDILHAHAMFFCGLPAIFVGKITKTPVVYEFRSLWMFQKANKRKRRIDKIIENLLLKIELITLQNANHAVLLNENLKEFLADKTKTSVKSTVINNAINTTLIDKLKRNQQSYRQKLVFGYIGTITSYEGIEFLVETFQELHDEGFSNELLLFGKGVNVESVKSKILQRSNINTIHFLGPVAPEDINSAFDQVDVIINPRLSTPLTNSVTPLKPLEAMAFEKLFIGSDVGGIKELITHNNGFLFKSEDKEDLKKVIKMTIGLSLKERRQHIESAFIFVKANKSWLVNAENYSQIYKSLIKES